MASTKWEPDKQVGNFFITSGLIGDGYYLLVGLS